jgi:peptide/nickel transport system permease protein
MGEGSTDMAETGTAPMPRRQPLPRNLVWGGTIITLILLLALLGPFVAPYAYDLIQVQHQLEAPSLQFLFGTDEFGRDVLSRTLYGARLSLFIGFAATAICLVAGVPLGLVAGYRRGRTEEAIMRSMDVLMSFPPVLLGLLILAVTSPSLWKLMVAVGIVYIPPIVRVTRSVTLEVAQEDFILAARARGERPLYILLSEILPNAWPPVIVEGSLRVTFAILLGAALSFLGLGAQPPSSDWGLMISEARPYVDQAPWIVLAPGLTLCITVIGINLLGDGLREMLDPRMIKRAE